MMMQMNPILHFNRKLGDPKVLVSFLLLALAISAGAQQPQEKHDFAKPTVSFQENKGQVGDQHDTPRPDVLFSGTDGQLVYHLKNNGIAYQLSRVDRWKEIDEPKGLHPTGNTKIPDQTTIYRLDVNWLNANTNTTVTKGEALPGVNNFYNAVCPNGVLGVHSFSTVTYQQVYPGIDLKWYSKENRLKYDYIVAPGADYNQIQLQFDGASSLTLNKGGELVIKTPLGELIEQAPLVLQEGKTLPSRWVITNNTASFQIEQIDAARAFTIDPYIRVWGTYIGGAVDETAPACATDALSNIYQAGETTSTSAMATSGSHQTVYGGGARDAYLVKLNTAGIMQWATYYGGSGNDLAYGVATDLSGNVFLTGYTTSTTAIATAGTHDDTYGGFFDGFLAQFNSNGVRQWGTYYGGPAQDRSYSCASDGSGNVYITGFTGSSTGISTVGSHQPTFGGFSDGYLAKFFPNGTLAWATYNGGNSSEFAYSVCVDIVGDVFICGDAGSSNGMASVGAHQTVYGGGITDAYVSKFNGAGVRLWSSLYGGTGSDYSNSCCTDAFGNVFLSGYTTSPNAIASVGSFQTVYGGGGNDGYLAQFNTSGVLQWGTYYGDAGADLVYSCRMDGAGNCYIMGSTSSTTNIATAGTFQTTHSGGFNDAFIAMFSSPGNRLWGTYYGGSGDDRALCGSTDPGGNIYISGSTNSTNTISSLSAWQPTFGGGTVDSYMAKFKNCSIAASPASQTNNLCFGGSTGTAEVTVTGSAGGNTFDWLPGNPAGDGTAAVSGLASGTYTVVVTDTSGCYTTQTFTITDPAELITTITAGGILCNGGTTAVTVIGVGGTAPYTGEGTFNVAAGFQSFTLTDANGCTATTSYTFTEPPAIVVTTSSSAILCNGDTSYISVSATGGVGGYSVTGPYAVVAGTYTYTVTDANGCTGTSTITVTQPTAVSVIPTGLDIPCNGGTTILNISGDNGVAPYYGGGAFTVSAGTYTFTLTDSDGCIGTLTFTVTEPTPVVAAATATPVFCNGETANVTVSATGGIPGYMNTGTFAQTAGTYSYIVSDTNGCADTTTITITEPTPLVVTATATPILCNGGTAAITITGSGGTPGYVNDGTFTQPAGSYTFFISDENGCGDSVNITVNEPAALVATTVTAAGPTTCGGTDGAIDIAVSGGTPGYSYLWNTTAITEDISALGAGVYSCAVTDTNGCTNTTTVTLTDPNPPTVVLTLGVDTVCNLEAAFALTGGSPAGGTYSGPGVSGGFFDPATANAGANTITYTYTDAQTGCSASTTDSIFKDPCSGVSENTAANPFHVYPNPNNGTFQLQLHTITMADVLVYDATGRVVFAANVQPGMQQQITIESAGVYLLSVITADGVHRSQRVIVNK